MHPSRRRFYEVKQPVNNEEMQLWETLVAKHLKEGRSKRWCTSAFSYTRLSTVHKSHYGSAVVFRMTSRCDRTRNAPIHHCFLSEGAHRIGCTVTDTFRLWPKAHSGCRGSWVGMVKVKQWKNGEWMKKPTVAASKELVLRGENRVMEGWGEAMKCLNLSFGQTKPAEKSSPLLTRCTEFT